MRRSSLTSFLAFGLLFPLTPTVQAQTASQSLDAAWISACAGATSGTHFFDRCQEILNAGPGSGNRRSAAALGNNLETFAVQGRVMMAIARRRTAVARAAQEKSDNSSDNFSEWSNHATEAESSNLAEGNRWALFGSFSHSNSDRSDTDFERGYDDTGNSYLLGIDYRFNNHWTGLIAMQRESRDIGFNRLSGSMDTDTDILSAVIAYNADNGFSANLGLNTGRSESTLRREISYTLTLNAGQPNESTVTINSRGLSESESTMRGADLNLGWEQSRDEWTFRYNGGLSLLKTEVGRIAENNDVGLDFLVFDQEVSSLQAMLGFEVARTVSSKAGVFQPYFRAIWRHEFQDDPRRIFNVFRGGDQIFRLSYVTGEPDRNFGDIGIGITGIFPHGWQAYAGWQRSVGHSQLSENRFDLGWRREF
ncbi:MAG: autotransporter outer membrane beta-barrel domain-containing protein [Arenimonas sp.]